MNPASKGYKKGAELFRASEQAARLLQEAQARAEQQLLAADPPPIELAEKKES